MIDRYNNTTGDLQGLSVRGYSGTRPVEAFKTSVAGSACNGHLIRKAIRLAVGLEDRLRADSVGYGVLNRD